MLCHYNIFIMCVITGLGRGPCRHLDHLPFLAMAGKAVAFPILQSRENWVSFFLHSDFSPKGTKKPLRLDEYVLHTAVKVFTHQEKSAICSAESRKKTVTAKWSLKETHPNVCAGKWVNTDPGVPNTPFWWIIMHDLSILTKWLTILHLWIHDPKQMKGKHSYVDKWLRCKILVQMKAW